MEQVKTNQFILQNLSSEFHLKDQTLPNMAFSCANLLLMIRHLAREGFQDMQEQGSLQWISCWSDHWDRFITSVACTHCGLQISMFVPTYLLRLRGSGFVASLVYLRRNYADPQRQGCGSGPFSAGSGSSKSEF